MSQPNESRLSKEERPFFTVVVPVWNRRNVIGRCLRSIFSQDFTNFEVIAVDDGSDDDSSAVIREFADPRLRLICHPANRGVCAARHTGTQAAAGRWIAGLDSDDEFTPGALRTLACLAEQAGPEVGVIGGYGRSDEGDVRPQKPMPEGVFGFEEYLRWIDTGLSTDYLSCRRREVFESLEWPTDGRLEGQFNMRVAKRWKMLVTREVIALFHTDCSNRYMSSDKSETAVRRRMAHAPVHAAAHEELLAEFASELQRLAPRRYLYVLMMATKFNFEAGQRWRGLRYGMRAMRTQPGNLGLYPLMFLGLIGPSALMRVRRWQPARRLFLWAWNHALWRKQTC